METEMDLTSQQILADALSNEMNRYWIRFNIFAAVQVGAVVGIVSNIEVLLTSRGIFRLVFIFLLWFSVTWAIAVLRGHDLQRSIVLALLEVEQSFPEGQRLLTLCQKCFRMPTFLSNYACSIFAVFSCVCWAVVWLWLEVKGYNGIVIPKL